MFADDLLLYKVINSPDDYNIIITPNDVNTLAKWVDENHFTLNASKCKSMVISRLKRRFVSLKLQWKKHLSTNSYL